MYLCFWYIWRDLMKRKKINPVDLNFILVCLVVVGLLLFTLSSFFTVLKIQGGLNRFTYFLGDNSETVIENYKSIFSALGSGLGEFSITLVKIFGIWLPLIYAFLILIFSIAARKEYAPDREKIMLYRILMTFVYVQLLLLAIFMGFLVVSLPFLSWIVSIALSEAGLIAILSVNLINTYSKRIRRYERISKTEKRLPENKIPVIRASICTGEQVAGFRDAQTGVFEEIMLIRSEKDKKAFAKKCGIDFSKIKKEW